MRLDGTVLHAPSRNALPLDCDLDGHGRLAVLWRDGGDVTVSKGDATRVLPGDCGSIHSIRWMGNDLLAWPAAGGTALLVDGTARLFLPCTPREVHVADGFIYASYGEEQFLTGTEDGDLAGDRVTVFDKDGQRLFGADALLGPMRDDPDFNELTQATLMPDDSLLFVADASPCLWRLDPHARTLQAVPLERPVKVSDRVDAVLFRDGLAGLLRADRSGLHVEWFCVDTGALAREDRAPALDIASHPSGRWRMRGVADGTAIAWDGQRLINVR